MLTVDQICRIYEQHGQRTYAGEPVTHLQHALQTATLAEQSGASAHMICAALLHDFGHLAIARSGVATKPDISESHQNRALPLLKTLFGVAVLEPIRLHVDAKRYLCAVDFDYLLRLTPNARYRLHTHGGVFTPGEVAQFNRQAYAQAALQLCRWDDQAKVRNMKTPDLSHFVSTLHLCASARAKRPRRSVPPSKVTVRLLNQPDNV